MINRKFLRKLIVDQLNEDYETMADDGETSLAYGSVDDQIDALIVKYERDSIPRSNDDSLSESLLDLSLLSLLVEQEADTPNTEPAKEPEEESEEISDPTGDEDIGDVEPASKSLKPPIDLDSFSRRIARLSLNFETLLDVKGAIVRRALKFLEENYDSNHADKLIDILNTKFDFEIGEKEETPVAPYAVGAYAGGAGGGGGV